LTVESPVVVVVICNSEHYGNLFGWDTGYNTYGNQYPETGFSGGILNFESDGFPVGY
jgi:hypothetical protein